METEVKTRRKIQLRMPGRRTATGKNASLLLIKRNKVLYLFILPAFLYFLIFSYVPMYGVQIAFKDFVASKGFSGSPWATPLLKHFYTFFSSVNFWGILGNTLKLSLYYIAASFPAAVILALMINEVKNVHFKKAVQNITYLPYFVSTVVLVGMINLFFSYNGLANNIGALFGAEPQMFLMKDSLFDDLYVWSGVWQTAGYSSIIYIAALSGVSPELQEAAIVDGCTRQKCFKDVLLPISAPGLVTCSTLSFLGSWNNFQFALILSGEKTRTLPVSLQYFVSGADIRWGRMLAATIVVIVPTIILTMILQKYIVQGMTAGAVKG